MGAEGTLLPVELYLKCRSSFGHGAGKSYWLMFVGVMARMLPEVQCLCPHVLPG